MSKPKQSNYQRYQSASWVWPAYYPAAQSVDPAHYRPVANWIGRLVLPDRDQRDEERGWLLELYRAAAGHERWVGQTVRLRFACDSATQARTWAVTRNVIFNQKAEQFVQSGLILAERVNRW